MTTEPGRILTDPTVVIQGATGGIPVRLPDGASAVRRGHVVDAIGEIASPYGNVELRAVEDGVRVLGSAAVPRPRSIAAAQLVEATEGILASTAVTIRGVDASSSGSISLEVEDGSGTGRVFLHAQLGISRDVFSTGQRVVFTGVVGERSASYRLWPRDRSDVRIVSGPPSSTPEPTRPPRTLPPSSPRPGGPSSPAGSAAAPALTSIARAVSSQGTNATVEGVVTAPLGLLDADGRRTTIQDGSGAILVRLPEGATSVRPGDRIRVTGEVDTYYGAPQLGADAPPTVLARGVAIQPRAVAAGPLAPGLEWQLVRVAGVIGDVSRDGDAWDAEVRVGSVDVPVAGIARSGIPADVLGEGRRVTVTGIVRRPYPTARDRRLAVVPRASGDIALGPLAATGSTAPSAGVTGGSAGSGSTAAGGSHPPTDGAGSPIGASTAPGLGEEPDVALGQLGDHLGRRVRVGGRAVSVEADGLELEDETGTARVAIAPGVPDIVWPPLGSIVNASGTVVGGPEGGFSVLVADASDLLMLPPPGRASPAAPPTGRDASRDPAPAAPASLDVGAVAEAAPSSPAVLAPVLLLGVGGAALLGAAGWHLRRRRRITEDEPGTGTSGGTVEPALP